VGAGRASSLNYTLVFALKPKKITRCQIRLKQNILDKVHYVGLDAFQRAAPTDLLTSLAPI
jgi:hypothetical protein